jgi:two-component system nitrate/nitrite response regulator NarL
MKKASTIRVLLVDDHPLVREGIRSYLARHDHVTVVGEAADGQQVPALVGKLSPDVVLMDLTMPRMNGLAATEVVCRKFPKVKVLVVTVHVNEEYIREVIRAGALGYVLKDSSAAELVSAIEAVYEGAAFFCSAATKVLIDQHSSTERKGRSNQPRELSRRERQVLMLIAQEYSNKEIATRLRVGLRTVESHREQIMKKLDIHGVVGLTKYAIAKGLVDLE